MQVIKHFGLTFSWDALKMLCENMEQNTLKLLMNTKYFKQMLPKYENIVNFKNGGEYGLFYGNIFII